MSKKATPPASRPLTGKARSLSNLKRPIEPGEVRNKTGKNGHSVSDKRSLIVKLLEAPDPKDKDGATQIENLIKSMLLRARLGNAVMAKTLLEQYAGKPKQALDLSNSDGTLRPRVIAYIPDNGRGPRADNDSAESASSETPEGEDEGTNSADDINDERTEEASIHSPASDDGSANPVDDISDSLTEEALPHYPGSEEGGADPVDDISDRLTEEASTHSPASDDSGADPAIHVIKPQPGFQERFLNSPADITIGGGAAGCGKSRASLMAPLAWIHLPEFRAVFFRRTTVEVRAPGGLWDESQTIYRPFGGVPVSGALRWAFPSGASVTFAHLEDTDTHLAWQGSSLALIVFDELCHFTEEQFWYLQSRNRSTCRVQPFTLATCNPDPDSWVAQLIAWWIDQETGLPIPERAGMLRYFTRWQGELFWGNDRQSVRAQLPPGTDIADTLIQSLTFVPGKLEENVILERADPAYRGKLMAMTRVNRARLLDGNWKVRADGGSYFRRSDVQIIDQVPPDIEKWVRRWDLAASEPTEANPDPDWTCGIKLGRYPDGRFVVADCELVRRRANDVRELVKRVAEEDGDECCIVVPQDPAQAGKDQAESYVRELAGYMVDSDRETGDKQTRVEPVAAQWQHGNIDVVRGPWNNAFFQQLEAFPDKNVHDDVPDALSGAFQACLKNVTMFDAY